MNRDEALARIRSELQKKAAETPATKALVEKINNGTATFDDTALYARWSAINLGLCLSDAVCSIDLSDRAAVCKALLGDQYEDINGFIDEVQKELDSRFGLQIAPQRAAFPNDRAEQAGQSLADQTKSDDVIRRRARAATETITKSFHDDRMKSEAKFRSKAGLKCYITRTGAAGCCKWCAEVAGRYAYGDEPHDVYRRHDNCDCTVTYENGRQRQDVWSKRTWEVPDDAGAEGPVRFSAEQAAELEAGNSLTKPAGSGTINLERYHAGLTDRIGGLLNVFRSPAPAEVSQEYLDSLPKLSAPDSIQQAAANTNPTKNDSNCQRCVPAYEMRRRGFDVVAALAPADWRDDIIGISGYRNVFVDAQWGRCSGNGLEEITQFLEANGHGTRVQISISLQNNSHLFVAENANGEIKFIDPQNNNADTKYYFDHARIGATEFARVDNLAPSELITQCLEVEK